MNWRRLKRRRRTVPNIPRSDKGSELFAQSAPALPSQGSGLPPASAKSTYESYVVPVKENAPQKQTPLMVDDPLNNWRQRRRR